jgi:hypothetical protein
VFIAIVAVLGANAWRLQRKRQRRETASYDGDERPVTKADVLVAHAFIILVVVVYLYGLFMGE